MNTLKRITWISATLALILTSLLPWEKNAQGMPPPRDPPTSRPDSGADDDDNTPESASLRRLTEKEVSRIRYLELRGIRLRKEDAPDRVIVEIPKNTVDDFLVEMQGHKDFQEEATRKAFLKLTPAQKLHYIAAYKGAAYADRVLIKSDPEVFVEFKKRDFLKKIIVNGCATSGCHGKNNDSSVGFHLFDDPKQTAAKVYADFVILNDLQVGGALMINRAHPEDSLLLSYMLPQKDVVPALRHPGKVEYRPIFRNKNAEGYKRLEKWITSLKHPSENYGVHLIPTSKPANSPDQLPSKPLE